MNIYGEPTITGIISPVAQITGVIKAEVVPLSGDISSGIIPKYYTGDYEFTPSEEPQIVKVDGLLASQNIIINPIPNDYGHVFWDGSTLTII